MRRRYTGPSAEVVAVVAARSGGWCEFPGCGHRAQDPHHRRERGMGGRHGESLTWVNQPANLMAACRFHNEWCSNIAPREAFAMGWRLREGDVPWLVPVQTRHDPMPVFLDNEGGWRAMEEVT